MKSFTVGFTKLIGAISFSYIPLHRMTDMILFANKIAITTSIATDDLDYNAEFENLTIIGES